MKRAAEWKFLAMAISVLMIMPLTGFAGDGVQWGSTPGQAYSPEVPALQDHGAKDPAQNPPEGVIPQAKQPASNLWSDTSPLSLPEGASDNIPQGLTEEESLKVLTNVNELINVALDTLKKQRESLTEKSGAAYDALNAEIQKYEEARTLLKAFLEPDQGAADGSKDGKSGPSKSTASDMLRQIGQIFGQGSSNTQDTQNPSLTSSENLIQQFTSYIEASVQKVREEMTEDALLPKAETFSAEETPEAPREEHPVLSRDADQTSPKHYQVLGSVVLSREMAKTYELLNPPQKLHPFLRWLFYGRHLTQVRAERYLAARAKVKEILMRAKAGEGLIRYKGKIMEMFLPLPGDESGVTFELVRQM